VTNLPENYGQSKGNVLPPLQAAQQSQSKFS
jgi:hypothetical protein